jgi:hypothetical protein
MSQLHTLQVTTDLCPMGRGRGLRGSERGERAALLTGDVNESSRGPRGKVAAWVVTGAVVAAAIVGTVVTLAVVRDGNNGTPSPNQHQRGYRSAAVATDAEVCSDMGVDVLKAGGLSPPFPFFVFPFRPQQSVLYQLVGVLLEITPPLVTYSAQCTAASCVQTLASPTISCDGCACW